MKHLKYLILSLLIFQYTITADRCGGTTEDINDCLNKDPQLPNYGCCGVKLNFKYYTRSKCFPAPNTKAGREYFLKALLSQYNVEDKNNIEYVCPDEEVEVKGYCSDFATAMVDNPSDCLGLSVANFIDRMPQSEVDKFTCCSVRNNKDTDDYTSQIPPHVNLCMPLYKDKEERDNMMKTLVNAWKEMRKARPLPFDFEDLDIVCGK